MKTYWLGLFLSSCLIGLSSSAEPVIIESPKDATVRQGDDVILRCVVEHLPAKDRNPVQWTRGDFALGFDRNLSNWDRYSMIGDVSIGEYHLHIKNANAQADENQYECQVTQYILRSDKAELTILVPPTGPFVDGEEKNVFTMVDVVLGKENEIVCRAIGGKPAATLRWYRNGIEIFEAVTSAISGPESMLYNTSCTLRITPNAEDADATYACVMSGDAIEEGQQGKKLIKLNLLKPPIVSVHLPPVIKEGEYVNVRCRAAADPPVLSYRWYLDGKLQNGEISSTLGLGFVNRTSNGMRIGCEARNQAGFSEKNVATLEVLYAPVLIDSPKEVKKEIGDNVTMWCEWDSNPKPSIRWIKEGIYDYEVVGTSSKLTLTTITQDDAGIYTCHATAGNVGSSKTPIALAVNGPPIFNNPFNQYAVIGEDTVVECSLGSDPGIVEVVWNWTTRNMEFSMSGSDSLDADGGLSPSEDTDIKYEGLFTEKNSTARLKIFKVSKHDLTAYTCKVTNGYGTKSADVKLEEDTTGTAKMVVVASMIGGAVGLLFLIIILILVTCYCVRTKKQQKSTNFDKVAKGNEKSYNMDEAVPINRTDKLLPASENNARYSVTSHDGGPDSTVSGSEDSNPTPTSGQDDGYHTEEANSWSRNDQPGKFSIGSASPAKRPSFSGSAYPGYVVNLPPTLEMQEVTQPLYNANFSAGDAYPEQPPRAASVNRYPFDQRPYDPVALPHTTATTMRSASALGDRLSPPPVRYFQRNYSDAGVPPTTMYAPSPLDCYLPSTRAYTPMNSVADSMPFENPAYIGRNRTTPIPAMVLGADRYHLQGPVSSSQSSLDKFEKGSALSASAAASRAVDPYEHPGRVSNLSSRLSQSSRSSDYVKPLTARMATHV